MNVILKDFRIHMRARHICIIISEIAPNTKIIRNERFVDNGNLITSGGISAGIDMSLYVIGLLYGEDTAQKTAAYMEYRRL
jgi:transcriptional regulator GlxA family with amidase domain